MDPSKAPNMNYLWCGLLVEELVRQGVAGFVISPGSRSAPLTVSVARNERAKYWVHYDERGAAFFALGLAKATQKPAVLICTSGSAAANYWPAVVEAAMARIPLILLTADRPPELLDCGANQAIDQTRLYGDYTRWYAALPCPTADCPPAYVLTTADQAWHRSQQPLAGPVHINVPLREPLDPKDDGSVTEDLFNALADWVKTGTPYARYERCDATLTAATQSRLLARFTSEKNGLLVVGRLDNSEDAAAAAKLAKALGWPLWADVTAGLRGGDSVALLETAGHALPIDHLETGARPSMVLQLGAEFVSKSLLQFLAKARPYYVRVSDTPQRLDPNHQIAEHIPMNVATFCEWLSDALAPWKAPASETQASMPLSMSQGQLTEVGVVRDLGALLPAGSLLFAGNSMPVRLVDNTPPKTEGVTVAANRGASGIDGNIATALGMAAGSGKPLTALLGDLTTLHDLNSLALHKNVETPFILIVLNNDGGGIFHYLPIARANEPCFEQCFGTPHGLDFEGAANMFGLAWACPENSEAFATAYQDALAKGGPTLIEIRSNRYDTHHPHQGDASTMPVRVKPDEIVAPSALCPVPLAGNPASPPVLLLHGFMGDMTDWHDIAQSLADTHHVWGVNLPGHGTGWTDSKALQWDMGAVAHGLMEHIKFMNIGPCALLGYSMGGRLALYLATEYPEQFTRVILESASPGLDTEEKQMARQIQDMALAERLEAMPPESVDYRAFLEEWYDMSLFESLRAQPLLREQLIERRLGRTNPSRVAQSLYGLGTGTQPNLWPALETYTTPTLLLVGEEDRKYRIIAEDMCAACPAMAMEAFADCGHIPHLEHPEAFVTTVRSFLKVT